MKKRQKRKPVPAWYKVSISHGPGHQSHTVLWRYSSKDEIEDLVTNLLMRGHFEWPIVEWRRLRKLPPSVASKLTEDERYKIKAAKFMIGLIKEHS